MAQSDSTAGDLAAAIREDLQRRGYVVDWIQGGDDTLGVTDENDQAMFVKVELA